ncbi:MAG TPA: phosphoesterase, partial [Verrucomicrobiae bacterium]
MKKRTVFWLVALAVGAAVIPSRADDFAATTQPVQRLANGIVTPVNQIVTPAGKQVDLPHVRPNALALSPNGKMLVTAGLTHELIALDPASGTILQRVALPADKVPEEGPVAEAILNPDEKAQLSFTGLIFSPDGSRIYLSNVNGDIKVFAVGEAGKITALGALALPSAKAPMREVEIPAGLAISRDGKKLYVAGNLSNRLLELDAVTGKVLRTWNTGVAPFGVALARNKVYVSNWGGRRPDPASVVGPAGLGTRVRVDARSVASEGSISVVDLAQGDLSGTGHEIVIGPHACALALSP